MVRREVDSGDVPWVGIVSRNNKGESLLSVEGNTGGGD
jgi:hypothetical protein